MSVREQIDGRGALIGRYSLQQKATIQLFVQTDALLQSWPQASQFGPQLLQSAIQA
jgi:hypothetical protein